MNNVFFYAAKDSKGYQQVRNYLANLSFNGSLIILPPGSQFSSPLCLQLRSNDIIILYAGDDEERDALIALHDEYDFFRVILILNNEDQFINNQFSILSPRFISYLDDGLENVSKYLENIFKNS